MDFHDGAAWQTWGEDHFPVVGDTTLGEPKTKSSRRVLGLSPTASALLRRHKAAQAAQRIKAGRKWQDMDFVFTTRKGTPLDSAKVTRRLKRFLPEHRFHDLRHTYATLALEAGVDLPVVSKSLGPSNVSTTADIYLHWTKRSAEQTASVMETVLASPSCTPRSIPPRECNPGVRDGRNSTPCKRGTAYRAWASRITWS